MPYTRRALLKFMATAAAAAASPAWAAETDLSAIRDQRTAGIRLGVISGSFTYDTPPAPNGNRVEALIAKMRALGLKHLEIGSGDMLPANLMAPGAPPAAAAGPYFTGPIPAPPPARAPGAPSPLPGLGSRSPEVRRWWLDTNLSHFEGIRRKFNDAGINIECFVGNNWETDEELRRDFDIARALGCSVLGRPYGSERVTRMAREAEKQNFPIYIHNEFEREADFVEMLAISPIIRLNFDVGNYTSAGETNHLEVLRKYHARISHLHLKARNKNGDFVEFGKSDSPVADVLRLMRDQHYNFAAMIENERASRQVRANIPDVESTLISTGKVVDYVKKILG